jgi:hypothetical protein
MKKEYIKRAECEREYGVTKYFLEKVSKVKGVKLGDANNSTMYYRVADVENAIANFNVKLTDKNKQTNKE